MFNNAVALIPPFSQNIYNKYCEKYGPNDYYSLFMTSAALFYERMPNFYMTVDNVDGESNFPNTDFDDFSNNKIHYVFVRNYEKDPNEKLAEGFTKHEKIETYINTTIGAKVYIRSYKDKNVVMFFARNFSLSLVHLLQIFIPKYFSELFKDKPVTEEEEHLLYGLTLRTDTTYRKEIENFLSKESFKTFVLKGQVLGFEKALWLRKVNDADSQVKDYLAKMEAVLIDYRNWCIKKNEAQIYADGLRAAADRTEEETEFEEYLCSNKNLTNISVDGDKIKFIVKTFVNPYLQDDWDCLSDAGNIFRDYERDTCEVGKAENLKLLLDSIFSRNHKFKLKVCGYIEMDFLDGRCTSRTNYDYVQADPNMKNYIPNGHLQSYNCFGQNMNDILTMLNMGDPIGAVECCINVVKRINVSESATFEPFVKSIIRCKGKCLVREEDGVEMTPSEAVEYLKENCNETTSDSSGETDVA